MPDMNLPEPPPLSPTSSKNTFSPSSTSFVYPVRSLLTAIQPADPFSRSSSDDHVSSKGSSNTSPSSLGHEVANNDADQKRQTSDNTFSWRVRDPTRLTYHDSIPNPDHVAQTSEHSNQATDTPSSRRRACSVSPSPLRRSNDSNAIMSDWRKSRKRFSTGPNFRHFPAEQGDPNVPRTFSTAYPVELTSPVGAAGAVVDPAGQVQPQEYIPAPLPLLASPALTATSPSLLPSASSPPSASPSSLTLSPSANNLSFATIANDIEESSKDFTDFPTTFYQDEGLINKTSGSPMRSSEEWGTSVSSFLLDSTLPAEPTNKHGTVVTTPATEIADHVPELPFNISQYGLVHLPPLPSPGSSERWSNTSSKQASLRTWGKTHGSSLSSGRSRSVAGSSGRSKYPSISPEPMAIITPGGTPASRSKNVSSQEGGSDSGHSGSGSGRASSSVPSFPDTKSNSESSNGSDVYVSFRFRYATDEHGNHIVVGREGQLQRCEDEPIRTPGAVQGFGVLVAVEDLENTLVVRQVSENSTELLGLSPRYLFSLECFTDTLPESSAGTLWDNIQFLTDPAYPPSEEEEDSSPHVFVLSGWGEPGSAPAASKDIEGATSSQVEQRRSWTCWCAVHRAQPADESRPGLIVMEFELESDHFNPLYPPASALNFISLSSSRTDASSDSGFVSPLGTSSPGLTVGGTSSSSSDSPPSLNNSTRSSITPSQTRYNISTHTSQLLAGLEGQDDWTPSAEDILESTTSHAKPLPALERLRRLTARGPSPYGPSNTSASSPSVSSAGGSTPSSRSDSPKTTRTRRRGTTSVNAGAVGMMDVFAVLAQINEQLGAAQDLDTFLKVTVGVLKDLTQFHRVLVYQFDDAWNGQVVAELVDWGLTNDLYNGLHFPAADIPKQARELYTINKVRVLYDRSQPTARIVVKDRADLEEPLNMTHCYLRAMSPIHIKYLENMGVQASMSVSIMAFDQLWGLVACHSYGNAGMRVSFPVRQMLRLLSQSISRNIERLTYARRLHTRKLINTLASDRHPTGYIVSNADDLLGLFDADFGILVIGEGAKILGPNQHGQEILIIAEYLRLKQFDTIQASQAVINDFPDLQLTTGFEVIAGLLYVPLSRGGKDFIAFLRRGQLRDVRWAGKPFKSASRGAEASLEPRKSFKIWSETVAGRSRAWTDEQLETAGVLALVYGKFIEVWRQKQTALQTNTLTDLLLSNATHEVRTPLNHIINYLEMAMDSALDSETRDNLVRSHTASKSLLFTINDLLDLTRLERGNETSFNEPFDLHAAIRDAVDIYQKEASRRNLGFVSDVSNSPHIVIGDSRKIQIVVQNLTANALKYTETGSISVSCQTLSEPEGLRSPKQTAVEIVVADTGCGIEEDRLEQIFREFEQVESSEPRSNAEAGVGLGLAVVARIVEQLGGQLRVDSHVGEGSRFSFLIPLELSEEDTDFAPSSRPSGGSSMRSQTRSRSSSPLPEDDEVEKPVETPASGHVSSHGSGAGGHEDTSLDVGPASSSPGVPEAKAARAVETDTFSQEATKVNQLAQDSVAEGIPEQSAFSAGDVCKDSGALSEKLRILIVEDNDINRAILAKRLTLNGHTVVGAANGQEAIDSLKSDGGFDAILMDIQMPIMNGLEATQQIRVLEKDRNSFLQTQRLSHRLNGRIPIFAVSASLMKQQSGELIDHGLDGWILKPIDFNRLNDILKGVTDAEQQKRDMYHPCGNWEVGGWLKDRADVP